MNKKIIPFIVIAFILATIGYFVGKTAKETYKQKDIQEEVSDSLNYGRRRWQNQAKNIFILDDPKGMFSTWENDYKVLYTHDLKDDKELDQFLLMVKQKYDSVG